MSDYLERIRDPIYRSPSGATFTLQFDDVERSGGKKAAIHELPQQDVADVQDLGNQSEKFPMSVYFTGSNYDTQADALWTALSERGAGTLQHPRYGNIPVLPLTWSQSEKFVDGLGRADFKIDFIRVNTEVILPITAVAAAESVTSATSSAIDNSVTESADEFVPENAADVAALTVQASSWLADYNAAFAKVTAVSETIQSEVNKAVSEFSANIDDLIAAPQELFLSMSNLSTMPAQVVTNIVDKIDAYHEQITNLALSVPESYTQALTSCEALFYAFAGASVATTIGTIATRGDAVSIANSMADISTLVQQAIENNEAAISGFRANPETLAALVNAMATARASILERSYSLKSERRVTMASERTPLDLIAEFYGDALTDIDTVLDDFIRTNCLCGNEILLIPAGREVVYYA